MRKENKTLLLDKLELNTGQVEWLPRNPRQWFKEDIDRMKASLQEDPDFTEDRPVLVIPHGEKFVVFAHNLTTHAAGLLGWKEVPCIIYYPATDQDHDTIKRRAIKDNGSMGSTDWDIMTSEWDDIVDKLPDWGLDVPEDWAAGGYGGAGGGSEHTATEDDFDETKDHIEVKCKPGDIWQLGDHRLMCGDSIDLQQVKALMGGSRADMVFTDPPYGVSYTDKNEFLNRIGKPLACVNPIENDNRTPGDMADFWEKAFSVLAECSKEKMVYYITAPQGGELLLLLLQSISNTPFALKHMLIWNKNNHVLGRCDYNYKHEPIIYGWKKKGTHAFYGGGKFKTTVWDIPKPLKNDLHPTMKPVELVANAILDGSKEGDIVLDTFGGSGTTLIAAEQLGRKCYMMELDPHYCDVIIARWEKLTGRKAVKLETS